MGNLNNLIKFKFSDQFPPTCMLTDHCMIVLLVGNKVEKTPQTNVLSSSSTSLVNSAPLFLNMHKVYPSLLLESNICGLVYCYLLCNAKKN
jgi:hypothetical protein